MDIQLDNDLVGGLEHVLFSTVFGIAIPTDEYFSEGLKPPIRYPLLLHNSDETVYQGTQVLV